MELDELKSLWPESAKALARSMHLNVLLLQQSNMRKVEGLLERLKRGIVFELALTIAGIVLIGWFAADNPQPRFLIPAALIDLYAIGLAISNARQLAALNSVDFDEPVVAIQQRLEELRVARIRTTLGALLFGPLMWLPFCIIAMRLLFGVDVVAVANPGWLAVNVLFGFAVIPAAVIAARVAAPRLRSSGAIRYLADEIAGRNLTAALADLDSTRRFVEE